MEEAADMKKTNEFTVSPASRHGLSKQITIEDQSFAQLTAFYAI
jgi:hypothetical protein